MMHDDLISGFSGHTIVDCPASEWSRIGDLNLVYMFTATLLKTDTHLDFAWAE